MKRPRIHGVVALVAAALVAALVAFAAPPVARAQMEGERPIGIQNDRERIVFSRLRCMCGGCARLPLSECTCGYAANRRDEIRAALAGGMTDDDVMTAYMKRYGTEALEIPPNEGANRLLYILPITAALLGAIGVGLFLRRLRRASALPDPGGAAPSRDAYDDKLDDELRRLDDDA
ncbi:MAG TPA: cytochrome c-type biogenesis protein CcmH [Byssovorax sp.]|jgi:cytochrome c-type biogenesis protein CcmH/NrfF